MDVSSPLTCYAAWSVIIVFLYSVKCVTEYVLQNYFYVHEGEVAIVPRYRESKCKGRSAAGCSTRFVEYIPNLFWIYGLAE